MRSRQPRTVGDFVPALLPAAIGGVLLLLGQREQAWFTLVTSAVVAALIVAGLDIRTPMSRLIDLVVRGVTNVLSWLVATVLFLPTWAWSRLRRHDLLRGRAVPGWVRVDRLAAVVTPPSRRPVRSAVGLTVLVLAVDLGAGIAWNRLTGAGPEVPVGVIRVEDITFEQTSPDTVRDTSPDPRAQLPAMAGAPWAEQYYRELNSVGSTYWPYTLYRPRSFQGEHVNIVGWERQGHRPADTDGAPVLAVFGGSAAFGEGQRDEWTIASYLSRLAERAGLPLVVRNFGQRGWVHWQEMTLYEQLLGAGESFDMALFYDGANDLTVQSEPVSGVPTHYDVDEYAARLAQPVPDSTRPVIAERGLWNEVVAWWTNRSLTYRAVGRATGVDRSPAAPPPTVPVDGYERRGVDVYLRGRAISQDLSDRHGVTDLYFWQPQRSSGPPLDWAAAAVGPVTVDLSRSLDGREDVYIDGVHTNEEGARLVAEAMWPTLEPVLRDWYEGRG